jgi:hypothetical protein
MSRRAIGSVPSFGVGSRPASGRGCPSQASVRVLAPIVRAPALERDAERHEQTAEQNRIGQRVGERGKLAAVRVELGERSPERFARAAMQLREIGSSNPTSASARNAFSDAPARRIL